MNEKPSAGCSYLVVDATGVGRPVVDLLRQKGLRPKGVTITGGDRGSQDGADWPVPKRELVSTIQVLLQGGRLKIAEELPNTAVLIQELLHFRVKIDLVTANDSYGPWRERVHDDLVLATALACWYGQIRRTSWHPVLADSERGGWTDLAGPAR